MEQSSPNKLCESKCLIGKRFAQCNIDFHQSRSDTSALGIPLQKERRNETGTSPLSLARAYSNIFTYVTSSIPSCFAHLSPPRTDCLLLPFHSSSNLAFGMHFLQGKDQDQSQLTQGQATFLGEFVCETLGLNYLLVRVSLWRINDNQRQDGQTYAIPDCVIIISASVYDSSRTIIVSACEILLVNSGSAGRAWWTNLCFYPVVFPSFMLL